MHQTRNVVLLALILSLAIYVAAREEDNGQGVPAVTSDFNAFLHAYNRADKQLNVGYELVRKAELGVFGEAGAEDLKQAQIAWIKYRDLEAQSAAKDPFGRNKVRNSTWIKLELTKGRTNRLRLRLQDLYRMLEAEQRINKRHDPNTDTVEDLLGDFDKMLSDDETTMVPEMRVEPSFRAPD